MIRLCHFRSRTWTPMLGCKSGRASILRRRAELTLIGTREGRDYRMTPCYGKQGQTEVRGGALASSCDLARNDEQIPKAGMMIPWQTGEV